MHNLPFSEDVTTKIPALSKTIKNGMSPIEADGTVKRPWVSAQLHEQSGKTMHTTWSKDELANYGKRADVFIKIVESMKELIAGYR